MRTCLLLLLPIALAACGFEQAKPAPVNPNDGWGKLAPDADRPVQADGKPAATDPVTTTAEKRA